MMICLAVAFAALVLAIGSSEGCSSSVVVQSGDTLGAIASAYGTTVAALLAANPDITDPNQIKIGQRICIPSGPPAGGASLYAGSGSGTYYYDVRTQCPQNPNGYPETDGYATCESFSPGPNQKTLRQGNSDNVVAIDMNVLKVNRAGLCGKKIIVTHNGAPVSAPDGGDFYVWDGCAACVGGGRIDFSVSGLRNADPNACNLGVVPGVSWQVVDVQSRPFVA